MSEDGLMIIEKGLDDRPIYIVMSTRPPELFSSGVEMYGVFWPLESQEPVATFVDEPAATEWAAGQYSEGTFVVRSIDATHNI
ncbi:MAG: hypothetical protein GTO41_04495, partial [Burkholderiales bacterium]|nr:hypothetical protein [Burkholderiales bacterium]